MICTYLMYFGQCTILEYFHHLLVVAWLLYYFLYVFLPFTTNCKIFSRNISQSSWKQLVYSALPANFLRWWRLWDAAERTLKKLVSGPWVYRSCYTTIQKKIINIYIYIVAVRCFSSVVCVIVFPVLHKLKPQLI